MTMQLDDAEVWSIIDDAQASGDASKLTNLVGLRTRQEFTWRAWTTRKGVRAWREEFISIPLEIIAVDVWTASLAHSVVTVHRLKKNGERSQAKDARYALEIADFIQFRPSALELLAQCLDHKED